MKMKSLKDYISSKEQPVVQEEIVSMEFLELHDEPLIEGSSKPHASDPPAVLVMKRKSIRQFPNNQKVAMYYIDKLDKYIMVPYDSGKWLSAVPEHVEQTSDVMQVLESIVDNRLAKSIVFADGKSTKVEPNIAESILMIHSTLNEENKQKISEMAIRSKEDFGKVVDFAYKHLN